MDTKRKRRPNISRTFIKMGKIGWLLNHLNSSTVNCVVRILNPTETLITGSDVKSLEFADVDNLTNKFLFSTDQGLYSLNYDDTLPLGSTRMSSTTPTLINFDSNFDKTKINHINYVIQLIMPYKLTIVE